MTQHFVVCPNCARHVRQHSNACPFCKARGTSAHTADAVRLWLAAVALGLAAGCAYGPPPEDPDDAGPDDAATDTQDIDRVGSDADIGG